MTHHNYNNKGCFYHIRKPGRQITVHSPLREISQVLVWRMCQGSFGDIDVIHGYRRGAAGNGLPLLLPPPSLPAPINRGRLTTQLIKELRGKTEFERQH